MLPMTLRQMEVFTAVVRHGSTVAAAGALGLSQSATSAALQQLERVLGTTLFERQGRALVLNAAGRTLLPQARNLLEQAQHLALSVGAANASTQPVRLHLAASSTIGNHVLPLVLARLRATHPHINVDLRIGNTEQVEHAVLALEVDLGLTEGPCRTPALLRQRLDSLAERLPRAMREGLKARRMQLQNQMQTLHVVSPLATLGRGYSILLDEKGNAIRSAAQTQNGQRLKARLGEGELQVRVEDNHLTPVTLSLLD